MDASLFLVVVTLVLLGLLIAYATSYYQGWTHIQDHAMRVGIGLLAFMVGIVVPYRWYAGWLRWAILAVGLGLLVATLLYGRSVKGAERWLTLPLLQMPIQPAEIAKFALPFWLAAHFAGLEADPAEQRSFVRAALLPGLVMFAFLVPTMLQRAIGTTFIMAASALAVFVFAGVKILHLALLTAIATILVAGGVLMFPHGWDRLTGFFNGERYQLLHSKIAIARGQLLGQWPTGSRQAALFVPEVGTDFTVAAICEEFGFVGSSGLFGLYGMFLWRGMSTSRHTGGRFGYLLARGIAVTVFLYAMVHMAVAAGLLPTTGQPLPFISFGGTAMTANLFAAGVLLNISRYARKGAQAPA